MMNRLKSIYVRLVFFKSNIQYHLRHLLKNYTLKGIRLSINDDKTLSKDLLLSVLQGGYEDKENKVLNEKLESNDIVLELGACIGFNSITAAKINGGKVVSYEANPNLIPILKKNQELNNISFEVRNKILLGKKSNPGTIPFNISENACMSSFIDYSMSGHQVKETKLIETEFAGDAISALSPTFLMVDIEGGEEELFSQSDFLKNSSIKKILIDVSPAIIGESGCSEVVKNIMNAGFDLVTASCNDSVLYFIRK